MNWIERTTNGQNAEFLLIVLVLFILGVLRQSEGQRLGVFIRAFINPSLLDQQLRQERAFNRVAVPLFLTILGILSIFLSLSFEQLGMGAGFQFTFRLLMFALLLAGLTLIRGVGYLFLAYLFDLRKVLSTHSTHWLLNNFILALIVLPISIGVAFGPPAFAKPLSIIGLALFLVFYIIRSLRLFGVTQQQIHVPLLYNVLYLCALEILPPAMVGMAIWRQVA
jgi:hypothetical protein